jgi:hypothetical protein
LDFNEFNQVKFKHNYPHFIYDLIHYLGGILEFIKADKKSEVNDKYKEMVTKQMNRIAIMNDVNLLTKRKKKGWMYDFNALQEKINDLNEVEGAVKRIDISKFLSSREHSPRLTYPVR